MKAHKQPKITLGVIIGISFAFTLITLFAVGSKVIFGNPDTSRLLNYQGKLTDANGPVTGTVSITFSIYDVPTGGSPIWTEPHNNVTVTNGIFNVVLGSINSIPDSVLNGGTQYLDIAVNGEPISPRQQIVSVLFAVKAQDADTVGGKSASDFALENHTHSAEDITSGTLTLRQPLILAEGMNIKFTRNQEEIARIEPVGEDLRIQKVGSGVIKLQGADIHVSGSAASFHVDVGNTYLGNAVFIKDQSGNQAILSADGGGLYIQVPNKAVRINGNLQVFGEKNAVVETKAYGKRSLYSDESAEVYFFDRGKGRLNNGEATIDLDPVFLETVIIDDEHPMLVQITLTDDCDGVYVKEHQTSFTVKELRGGKSNATFNWEVAAKRRGYENIRLKEVSEIVTKKN